MLYCLQRLFRNGGPFAIPAVLAMVFASPAMAASNLLTNGDFESTGTGNIKNADMVGWKSASSTHTHIAKSAKAGIDQYAVLNYNEASQGITQKFDVVNGQAYQLNYDYGVAKGTTAQQNLIEVAVGPNSGPIFAALNDADGPSKGQLWQSYSYTFTATKTGVFHILFDSVGTNDNTVDTAFIDNVSIQAVPEACTVAVFCGLLTMGGLVLRRRSRTI